MSDPQTWNGYSYVGNNPLNYTDPSGLGFGDFLDSVIFDILDAATAGIWGAITAAVNGTQPGPGPVLGINWGEWTGCGGPLGNCGSLGSGPWSEQSGLGDVQDPGRFIFDATNGATGPGSFIAQTARCAAEGSEALSLNSALAAGLGKYGYDPNNFFAGAFFGSVTAAVSNAITGPDRVTNTMQFGTNAPGRYSAVSVLQGAVGKVPTSGPGFVQVAQDSGGRWFGVSEKAATLADKGLFRMLTKAIGTASLVGAAWDTGTYIGSFLRCAKGD